MIGVDISAITTDLQSGEWKGATILAASCCEALLLHGLRTVDSRTPTAIRTAIAAVGWTGKSPNPADLMDRSWDLFWYTEIAWKVGLIADGTRVEVGRARDYRNLIHPAKTMRENVRCDRGTAYIATGALEHVVSDLRVSLR
jgi:hypothetical protein